MNRQIEFRGWDAKYGFMVYSSEDTVPRGDDLLNYLFVQFEDNSWGFMPEGSGDRLPTMQYTGLKDKNGKKVFEGDIYNLEGWNGNPYYCVWHDGIYWNKGCAQTMEDFLDLHVNVADSSTHDLRSHIQYTEIIGNIFENPELLKNKNENENK